jgi:hypothetical protein
MSAALDTGSVEAPDDEAERLKAQRKAQFTADEEIAARLSAEFEECIAKVEALVRGDTSGDLHQPLRELGETAHRARAQNQRMLNLRDRWEREDAGEVKRETASLRKTEPAQRINWKMVATPLLKAIGPDSPFTCDDPRLLDHDLLVALRIGQDLSEEEQASAAFRRLMPFEGAVVDTDLLVGIADSSAQGPGDPPVRLLLRGLRLPPIEEPEDAEAQRWDALLRTHEARITQERRGSHPVVTRAEQGAARHGAWRAVLQEWGAELANRGKPASQRENELAALLPAWAAALSIAVPRR